MKREEFLDIMNDVDEELLARADRPPASAPRKWARRIAATAAAVALLFVGGRMLIFGPGSLLDGLGANAGGGGRDDLTYMNYAGPVLPLTVLGESDGITATRHIDFDFDLEDPHDNRAHITDRYTLTNSGTEDKTMTLVYPLSSSLSESYDYVPTITVGGEKITADVHAGPYTGGYMGAWGGKQEEGGSVNIDAISSYEEFRTVIENGYMDSAFDAYPILDQTVIIYEITQPRILTADVDKKDGAPTLAIHFDMDFSKTRVLTYNFSGGMNAAEEGKARRSFFVPIEGEYRYDEEYAESHYLVLLGEDIAGYSLQGYEDGGCDRGEEIDITAEVTRYEMALGDFLMDLIVEWRGEYPDEFKIAYGEDAGEDIAKLVLSNEDYLGLAAELMTTDGPLSDFDAERYSWGHIGDILTAVRQNARILYLTFDVIIPAGETVEVACSMFRSPHVNFVGDKKDRSGYDMSTTLGTTLTFTEQNASISGYENVEIVAQNFGFDLATGVTEVKLDLAIEHYWMEMRRVFKGAQE